MAAERENAGRFIVRADEKLSAFVQLEREVLPVTFYLDVQGENDLDCFDARGAQTRDNKISLRKGYQSKSYTSTRATPMVLFTPRTIAV